MEYKTWSKSGEDYNVSLYISTHLRKKFTFVDVKIGSANPTSLHLDQNVVVPNLWERESDNAIMLRLGVSGLNC